MQDRHCQFEEIILRRTARPWRILGFDAIYLRDELRDMIDDTAKFAQLTAEAISKLSSETDALAQEAGEVTGRLEKRIRDLEIGLGQLRADLTVQRAHVADALTELPAFLPPRSSH